MIDNIKIEACDLTYDEIHPLLVRVAKEFDPPFFVRWILSNMHTN